MHFDDINKIRNIRPGGKPPPRIRRRSHRASTSVPRARRPRAMMIRVTARTVVLGLVSLAVAACGRGEWGAARCPKGTSIVEARSRPPASFFCQDDDPRTHRAVWFDVHPGGARRQECSYAGDRAHGPYRAFQPDGRLKLQGSFAGGLRSGVWQQFDAQGSLAAEATYRDGVLVSGSPIGAAATCGS